MIENIFYCEIVSYIISVILNVLYLVDYQTGQTIPYMDQGILAVGIVLACWNALVYIIYAVFRLPLDYQINQFNFKRTQRVKRTTGWQKTKLGAHTIFFNGSFAILLYIIFTILSMTVQPWFIAFNLLLIVNLIETMNYVLKSVTRYKGQLFMTYVFGLIIVYFFSVLNYTDYAFKFQVTPEDPSGNGPIQINQIIGGNDPNEQFCSALLPCYLNVINNAIRSGNGIVALQTTESIQSTRYVAAWFNAIFFFYFINIFMLNVIFGIIISTFATLRQEQTLKQTDRSSICFMCHIPRSEFEKYKISFEEHQAEHDKWKYIYFMHMMNKKTYKDCNALENYLKQRIDAKSSDWMPLGRSKSLEYAKKDIIQVSDQAVGQSDEMVKELQNVFDAELQNISNIIEQIMGRKQKLQVKE